MHLFLRFVKFGGQLLRFFFANDLLEELRDIEATFAFVAVDGQLDGAVGGDGNFIFAFGHSLVLPVTNAHVDGLAGVGVLLDDDVATRLHLLHQTLINVLLDDALA